MSASSANDASVDVRVASTFTSDTMEPYLEWWAAQVFSSAAAAARPSLSFQPLNTVVMQLLDPTSDFNNGRKASGGTPTFNAVMVRWEDTWRFVDFDKRTTNASSTNAFSNAAAFDDDSDQDACSCAAVAAAYCDELLAAVRRYAGANSTPLVIMDLKPSPDVLADPETSQVIVEMGQKLRAGIETIARADDSSAHLTSIPWKTVDALYPVKGGEYYCKDTDVMAQVPYTDLYTAGGWCTIGCGSEFG